MAAVCLAATVPQAVQERLDVAAVAEAISIGQTTIERDLTRFHQPYRIDVARPPVDYLEVVTPFRRIVLAAQARARAGDRRFGQREALAAEAASPAQIDLYAELTFHPLNTYVFVPPYRLRVRAASGGLVEPRSFNTSPRYGPRVDGGLVPYTPVPIPGGAVPGRSQPMLGATVMAAFDAETLADRCDRGCDVEIGEEGQDAVRVPLRLRDLR